MDGKYSSSRQPARRSREASSGASLLSKYPMLTLLVLFGIVFFLVMKLKSPDPSEGNKNNSESLRAPETSTAALPAGNETTTVAAADSRPIESAVTTEAAVPITSTTEPVPTEPASGWMTVDDRYFSDALFLGDSRTDGLCLYSPPGEGKHYPKESTSMTIFKIMESKDDEKRYGFETTRDLLQGMQFGKIYLMFGINECGYDTEYFAETYKKVVDEIREYQPDALIYIQSIGYVTQEREKQQEVFASSNIKEKNEAIKALANDKDIVYLEVNDVLNDGTDHLPADYSGPDGAHLKPPYYQYWHDYLLEHAYVDEKHPWEPENENTTEPEGAAVEHP